MAYFNILDLDCGPVSLASEFCTYKYSACIKIDLLKTHYHIRLCNLACLSIIAL